jgi:poly(A) polymerase
VSRLATPPDAHLPLWLADARDGHDRSVERARLLDRPPTFPLQGKDALAMDVAPGPVVGALLGEVERWWLESGTRATREECLGRLRELVAGRQAS